jgi:ubiquinone/menaquinone biosynthesis C-methylase UbiE
MSTLPWFRKIFKNTNTTGAATAYDLWSADYDQQPGNLMLDLDEAIFSELLNESSLSGKVIVDIGCGTGRHWQKMSSLGPAKMIGYDISKKMLERLTQKFPGAETYLSRGTALPQLKSASADMIVSTLTIAHIEKIEEAFTEWTRVLKPGGEMILSDYHPEALARGAKRTFTYKGKKIAIKNYIHSTNKIRLLARQLGYTELRFIEQNIDENVKSYYEKQNAMDVYTKFSGTPIIYGLYLKKGNDPA